jgi:hypothetical protein
VSGKDVCAGLIEFEFIFPAEDGGVKSLFRIFCTRHFGKFYCLFGLPSLPGDSPPASSAPKIQQNLLESAVTK